MNSIVSVGPSPIHGHGLFTNEALWEGQRIIEYFGERISKNESIRRCSEGNQFIFCLDASWDIDGNVESNLARFINHHCAPNCVIELIEGRLWVSSARAILAGEELTFDYGYDLSDYREHPCSCGSPNCVGYILAEELRELVHRAQATRLAGTSIEPYC